MLLIVLSPIRLVRFWTMMLEASLFLGLCVEMYASTLKPGIVFRLMFVCLFPLLVEIHYLLMIFWVMSPD